MQAIWSEHWHAVRELRPRLRDGVQVLHRRLRRRAWVLLFDPATQRFHRLAPPVWQLLRLLDGRRSLDEVWQAACALPVEDGRSTISQTELLQLMASLHANDLLQSQAAPDADEMFERHQKQRRQRFKQAWLNPLNIRLPLLHPDAWYERHAAFARRVASWPVLVAWLALVLPAVFLASQHWGDLTNNLSDRVLAASNVVLLWFIYPVVKAVHEWAHGLMVKAFGGTVREMGLMFMVLTPVPYVDASSSYRFPSKWSRALVAAAGIMAELALGAVAVYVWLLAEPGLVTTVAFNVILIAGVSTVLVNGNPLMRYDGYFIACDLLEVPNLGQRATEYLGYLVDRYVFGARDAQAPVQARGERLLLLVYGVLSPIYRLFITFGLVWFVASEYLFIGAVMALLSIWSAVVVPMWRGWRHLSRGASLAQRRRPALRRSALLLGAAALFIGLVPLPFHSVQQAVVWVPDEAIVRAGASGLVIAEPVGSGLAVGKGAPLLMLDSPALEAEAGQAAAAVAGLEAQLRQAEVQSPQKVASLRAELASRQAKLADARLRLDALAVTAHGDGRWLPAPATRLTGRYARRGEILGYVVAGPSRVIRSAVTQEDMDLIRSRLRGVEVRLAQQMDTPISARFVRQVPGGDFDLVSEALGSYGGGEIAVDPAKTGNRHALKRVFDVELLLDTPSPAAVFGDRAYVRFDLGLAPLAWQWFLRLRQLFLARLNV